MGDNDVTASHGGIEYWRTLAEERQRRLEELRELLLSAIDTIPDRHVGAFVAALDASRPSWLREIDAMESSDPKPAELLDILDDLWRRVAAGGSRG